MANAVHAVGVIFENEAGEILVCKRHIQDPEGGTWGLAGGKVKAGEDIAAAAAREVREEIGHAIDTAQLQFLKTYHWERQDMDLTFDVFKLITPKDRVTIDLAAREHTACMWISPAELYKHQDLMEGLYPILADTYRLKTE